MAHRRSVRGCASCTACMQPYHSVGTCFGPSSALGAAGRGSESIIKFEYIRLFSVTLDFNLLHIQCLLQSWTQLTTPSRLSWYVNVKKLGCYSLKPKRSTSSSSGVRMSYVERLKLGRESSVLLPRRNIVTHLLQCWKARNPSFHLYQKSGINRSRKRLPTLGP